MEVIKLLTVFSVSGSILDVCLAAPSRGAPRTPAMWYMQINWTLVGALLLNCALWIGFLILYL
jgi:hypothetical protein